MANSNTNDNGFKNKKIQKGSGGFFLSLPTKPKEHYLLDKSKQKAGQKVNLNKIEEKSPK